MSLGVSRMRISKMHHHSFQPYREMVCFHPTWWMTQLPHFILICCILSFHQGSIKKSPKLLFKCHQLLSKSGWYCITMLPALIMANLHNSVFCVVFECQSNKKQNTRQLCFYEDNYVYWSNLNTVPHNSGAKGRVTLNVDYSEHVCGSVNVSSPWATLQPAIPHEHQDFQ